MSRYYSWDTGENSYSKKLFVLVIYDITNDKRRVKFAKTMSGYGFRVQRSAFEAIISERLFVKLKREIPHMINGEEDSVRIYRMTGYGEVDLYGVNKQLKAEDVIIVC